jgi:hypothetical protein
VDPAKGCGRRATNWASETSAFLQIRERNRMSKQHSAKHFVYHVYKDNVRVESFSTEPLSFNCLKEQAKHHKTAEFRVEKSETIFDSSTSPEDKKMLDGLRSIERDNSIHASIHDSNRNIGREDDE